MKTDLRSTLLSSLMALDRTELERLLPFLSGIAAVGSEGTPPELAADLLRRQRDGRLEKELSDPRAIACLAELLRSLEVLPQVPKVLRRAAPKGSVKAGPLARAKLLGKA